MVNRERAMKPHLRAMGCHLPCGITQFYLPPDTSEHTRLNPSQTNQYSIYLLRRHGRLTWPSEVLDDFTSLSKVKQQ